MEHFQVTLKQNDTCQVSDKPDLRFTITFIFYKNWYIQKQNKIKISFKFLIKGEGHPLV